MRRTGGKAFRSKGEAVSRRLTDEGCFGVLLCPPPHPPQCAHWGTFPQGKAYGRPKTPLSKGAVAAARRRLGDSVPGQMLDLWKGPEQVRTPVSTDIQTLLFIS